ncbi:hypothetical protein [Streptomyces nitrosporeus]|uniref:hypothetical protein n=1 Tax=Streptomyces nitrosporeus TaxID=28894 RepID=UPI0039A01E37
MGSTSVRRTTMDSTVVRTAMVRHRLQHRTTPTITGTRARWCAAPKLRSAPVRLAAVTPLSGSATPLVQLCYRDVFP